ncbi:cytochrome d ubiquinol oxidase subunit II [Thioclava sp. JE_KL1]|uniref:cytochrome d ubiquinol oxidase subunit II n=1 Tax=Thioclava sp. JE_KL1 TaxID=2651187 RepID=UPI00128CA952|nr:cytochrome d ubiquinol oxidase subunit II [Thioclava sp. JE_KL1]MPQ95163.1 cytochrome d ubiquinol oxidase subunit II [Thioclava sp. JE_KL1]
MSGFAHYLPDIWAAIIAFAILTYVVLDGFDLGIGILFPFLGSEENRTRAMNSVAPVWDGNETWLVMGGGGLLAVFPLAYGIILNALYVPIIIMLLSLAFRGVAFEFRGKTRRWQKLWDKAFFGGSLIATLAQGAILGGLLRGPEVTGRTFTGGPFDWVSWFSLGTALALVAGYVMLGSAWLVIKTSHGLYDLARRVGQVSLIVTLGFIGLASLATPFLHPEYYHRWFQWPGVIWSAVVPLLLMVAGFGYWTAIRSDRGVVAYLSGIAIFILCFMGLGLSIFPYIVPASITIREASTTAMSQGFILVGAAIFLPIILAYTAYAYWVFRGKTSEHEHHY